MEHEHEQGQPDAQFAEMVAQEGERLDAAHEFASQIREQFGEELSAHGLDVQVTPLRGSDLVRTDPPVVAFPTDSSGQYPVNHATLSGSVMRAGSGSCWANTYVKKTEVDIPARRVRLRACADNVNGSAADQAHVFIGFAAANTMPMDATMRVHFEWAALASETWHLPTNAPASFASYARFLTRAGISVWEVTAAGHMPLNTPALRSLDQTHTYTKRGTAPDSAHHAHVGSRGRAETAFTAKPVQSAPAPGEPLGYPYYRVALGVSLFTSLLGGKAASTMEMQINSW